MTNKNRYDMIVVGGGAAGLAAALTALCAFQAENKSASLAILERNPEGGKKIAVTGNGRCNVTNMAALQAEYGSETPELAKEILQQVTPQETLAFLEQQGLFCREESERRVYPLHGQASAVRDRLVCRTEELGADWKFGFAVKAVEQQDGWFRLLSETGEEVFARAVVLAPGGKAGIKTGSQGDGYRWLRGFGHTVVRPHPALVQLTHEDELLGNLKGVRTPAKVTLLRDGVPCGAAEGEVQFAAGQLSGICVFDLSGKVKDTEAHTYEVTLDLLPDLSLQKVTELLSLQQKQGQKKPEAMLSAFLPQRLAEALAPAALGEEPGAAASLLKAYTLTITGTKGWVEAQVTAGGISLAEVQKNTLESLLVPGLYLAGELLDADGPCGGYNLQWAWTTGILAGRALAAALKRDSVEAVSRNREVQA